MIQKIRKFLSRYIYPSFFYFLPIQKDKLVFSSFGGRNYAGNPKIISEKLHQKDTNLKIIWIIQQEVQIDKLPEYIIRVNAHSLKAAFHLYTAKVWVDDCRKTIVYKKRTKQTYFQTWHGTPLKLIEFDARENLPVNYLKYAKKDSESLDYLFSGNEYSSNIYKNAFKVSSDKIYNVGTPRNDGLINSQRNTKDLFSKKEIKILYAPTFRNNLNLNGIPQLEQLHLEKLISHFSENGQQAKFYIKFHPNVNKILLDSGKLHEAFSSEQVQLIDENVALESLFYDIDVLITDYSSVFFDFALLNKPIILFNYDEEHYKKERGFYLQLKDLPLPCAQTADELLSIFKEQQAKLIAGPSQLLSRIGNFEKGTATEFAINEISKIMKE